MKPFVFRTNNNNCYLYSPAKRNFIPIPSESYAAFEEGRVSDDQVLSELYAKGFLSEHTLSYNRKVQSTEIEYALVNIPQIVFEVTTNCNLKCKYCCYGNLYETFSERKNGTLEFKTAQILLDYISTLSKNTQNNSYNVPLVLSFYGGEPLLNVSLIHKIVSYAKTLNFGNRPLRFSLTTNATNLSKHIDFLKDNNFFLLISLDGNSQNNAYRILQNNHYSFEDVMSNIMFVKDKYPAYFNSNIRFNAVFSNLSDINQLFEFFTSNFNKIPTLSPLHYSDGEREADELKIMRKSIPFPDSLTLEKYPDAFLEYPIHKKIIQMLMYMTDSLFYNELSFLQSDKDFQSFPTHTCIPFTKRLFLSFDGKIMPCEKVNRTHPFARIENDKLIINFEEVAHSFNSCVSKYRNWCSSCAMEFLCNHCAYSSMSANKCPEYKSFNEIKKILGDVFSYIENNPKILSAIYDNVVLK